VRQLIKKIAALETLLYAAPNLKGLRVNQGSKLVRGLAVWLNKTLQSLSLKLGWVQFDEVTAGELETLLAKH
jgi:hypothetical protein